jgi:hypothetical protein
MELAETSEGLEGLARRGIIASDEVHESGHEISRVVEDKNSQSDWVVREQYTIFRMERKAR